MVGILSIQSKADFGLDMTLSTDAFRTNGRDYGIVRRAHMRDSLCGRATAVYSLYARTGTTDTHRSAVGSQNRTLTLAREVASLPDKIMYKMSYPIERRTQEGLLFSKFLGQFGIVDVVGFYVCGPKEPHGSIEHLFQNANFWSICDDANDEAREPEERRQQCIAMSSEGQSLSNFTYEGGIPSPGDLLETILHAIIGHCILFFCGALHRDISSGNVLRHLVPVKRPPLKMCALQLFACSPLPQFELTCFLGFGVLKMLSYVRASWLMGISQLSGARIHRYRTRNHQAHCRLCPYASLAPGCQSRESCTLPLTTSSPFCGFSYGSLCIS
ncbi:hypothetical protein BJV78DRAFT_109146 [Lactifluus subvellereus]|nr:hypothetical protein BJV78DRAFT_109146 [Lactifluus subvellereus]